MKVLGYGIMITSGVAALAVAYSGFSKVCTAGGAHKALKAEVLGNLKSPATAVFGEATKIERATNCFYSISGVVDSQNSYGAMMRTTYTGSVIGREYIVTSVSLGE